MEITAEILMSGAAIGCLLAGVVMHLHRRFALAAATYAVAGLLAVLLVLGK